MRMVGGHVDQVHSCDRDVGQYESTSGRNVTTSGKFAFTWSDSGRLIPDVNSSDPGQLASHSNHNPGFKFEDMNSVYSDAGDTFASLSFGDYNEGDASVSPCLAERSDHENSRDFIMRRFLSAAQALTTEAALSAPPSLVSKPSPFAHRVIPMLPRPNKTRFAQEVKLDEVQDNSGDGDGGVRVLGGFASRLGRMTLKHLKYGFRTSTLSNKNPVSQKKLHGEISGIDSDIDLLISDDEEHSASEESNMKPPNKPNSKLKYLEQDFSKAPVEIGFQHGNSFMSGNFMRTSHTLNSQGFLGLPKPNNLNKETARGVAMDTSSGQKMHVGSQGNYVDSHVVRINEHEEIEDSSHGPSTISSSSADSPKEQLVGVVARREGPMLMPLPSLKSPSESWLCITLPPASRFLAVKKMPQKTLRRHPSHRPVRQIDQPLG